MFIAVPNWASFSGPVNNQPQQGLGAVVAQTILGAISGTHQSGSKIIGTRDISLFGKASQFPAHDIGVVEVPFWGGRKIQLAGDRTGNEWTATFISDANLGIRRTFERWQNGIVNHRLNYRSDVADTGTNIGYLGTAIVTQYTSNVPLTPSVGTQIAQTALNFASAPLTNLAAGAGLGFVARAVSSAIKNSLLTTDVAVLRAYRLTGIWPSSVAAIDVAWDQNDSYEEFQVTFRYQWMEIAKPSSDTGDLS